MTSYPSALKRGVQGKPGFEAGMQRNIMKGFKFLFASYLLFTIESLYFTFFVYCEIGMEMFSFDQTMAKRNMGEIFS